MSHNFVIEGKVYIKMDAGGRFGIPPQMYPCAADTRLRYDVSVAEDGAIVVTFRRHLPYAKGKQRIYISPKIREQYGYDSSNVFECIKEKRSAAHKQALTDFFALAEERKEQDIAAHEAEKQERDAAEQERLRRMVEDDASDFDVLENNEPDPPAVDADNDDGNVNPILNQFPDQESAEDPEEDLLAAEFDAMSDDVESFDFGEEDEF